MTQETIHPVVNGNGTDRKELVEQRMTTLRALSGAEAALAGMSPNGRDYIGEPELFRAAVDQHVARQKDLSDMRKAITEEVMRLQRLD